MLEAFLWTDWDSDLADSAFVRATSEDPQLFRSSSFHNHLRGTSEIHRPHGSPGGSPLPYRNHDSDLHPEHDHDNPMWPGVPMVHPAWWCHPCMAAYRMINLALEDSGDQEYHSGWRGIHLNDEWRRALERGKYNTGPTMELTLEVKWVIFSNLSITPLV